MEKHKWEIKIKDGIDTYIYVDNKEIPYIENFKLSQDVNNMKFSTLELSLVIVSPIEISSKGRVIINNVEVSDDIAKQVYLKLKEKFEK